MTRAISSHHSFVKSNECKVAGEDSVGQSRLHLQSGSQRRERVYLALRHGDGGESESRDFTDSSDQSDSDFEADTDSDEARSKRRRKKKRKARTRPGKRRRRRVIRTNTVTGTGNAGGPGRAVSSRGEDAAVTSSVDAISERTFTAVAFGQPDVCPHCAARVWRAERSRASFWQCCRNGEMLLPDEVFPHIPAELQSLYEEPRFSFYSRSINNHLSFTAVGTTPTQGQGGLGMNFAMPYPSTGKLQGKTYHVLSPIDQCNPGHSANIYIIQDMADPQLGVASTIVNTADRAVYLRLLALLRAYLLQNNPVAAQLRSMMELTEAERRAGGITGLHIQVHARDEAVDRNEIAAYYRSSTSANIPPPRYAVIFPITSPPQAGSDPTARTADGTPYNGRTLINENSALYESLQFPVIFPTGQGGWFNKTYGPDRQIATEVRSTTGKPMTLFQYVHSAIFQRPVLQLAGRCAQEYLLDQYSRWQAQKFAYLRYQLHRPTGSGARVVSRALAHNITTSRRSNGNLTGSQEYAKVGRLLSLPSSVPGSKKYQQRLHQDGMTVVEKLGKPTLFITMTCNPNWPDIVNQLAPGQNASDNPILVNRVFNMMLTDFLRKLRSGYYFGVPSEYLTYVVEFQKRGLPHAHIAVRLQGDQPRSPSEIDAIICAELPVLTAESSADDRIVHEIVSTHMRHECRVGRCFSEAQQAAGNAKCKYGYPFPECDVTHEDECGYVQYRRRGAENACVVSYFRPAILEYRTHINVQIAHTVAIIGYLRKYFVKGIDMMRVSVPLVMVDGVGRHDELEEFERARYLSAVEAGWKFLNYDINHLEPGVQALAVHGEGEDMVAFDEGGDLDEAGQSSVSALLRYFQRPRGSQFDSLTFLAYYEKYNVRKSIVGNPPESSRTMDTVPNGGAFHVWPRQRLHICRMYSVRPSEGTRYFIRKLLQHIPARSFTDLCTDSEGAVLRTAEGLPDYQGACYSRGLIATDGEYADAMAEAVRTEQIPYAVRCLFADCIQDGANPATLMQAFLGYMCHDFEGRTLHCLSPGYVPSAAAKWQFYKHIQDILEDNNKTMAQYGLPDIASLPRPEGVPGDVATPMPSPTPLDFVPDKSANRAYFDENEPKLTHEQRAVLNAVVNAIEDNSVPQRCFFVDGPGGRGKSFLIKVIAAWARRDGRFRAWNGALTGMVSMMYPHGITLHKTFKLPLEVDITNGIPPSSVEAHSVHGNRLAQFDVFLIDELPMLHSVHLTLIDECLRNVRGDRRPFGGAVIVGAGDFRQLPPVVPGGSHADIVSASVISNRHWPRFVKYALTIPQRDRSDPEWSAQVMDIGSGTANRYDSEKNAMPAVTDPTTFSRPHYVRLPPQVHVIVDDGTGASTGEEQVLQWLYGASACANDQPSVRHAQRALDRAILCPYNAVVDTFNAAAIKSHTVGLLPPGCDAATRIVKLYAEEKVAPSEQPQQSRNVDVVTDEFMAGLTNPGVPDHTLELVIGCIVIVLRNMSVHERVMNGTRLEVLNISRFLLTCRKLDGSNGVVLLPRIRFTMVVPRTTVKLTRRQFPVRLAYAMTVNRGQGQTIPRVCIDLRRNVFTHGMLYVALSRVPSASSLAAHVNRDAIGPDGSCYVLNMVYHELVAAQSSPIQRQPPSLTPFRVRTVAVLDSQDNAGNPSRSSTIPMPAVAASCSSSSLQALSQQPEPAASREVPHQTFSWLFVPLIQTVLGVQTAVRDMATVRDALAIDPTLWTALVDSYAVDFQRRGINAHNVQWASRRRNYLPDHEQVRLLEPSPLPGGCRVPEVLYQRMAFTASQYVQAGRSSHV